MIHVTKKESASDNFIVCRLFFIVFKEIIFTVFISWLLRYLWLPEQLLLLQRP